MSGNHLKIKEASAYLGVHKDTLRNWEKQGLIQPLRLGRRQDRYYPISMLDKIINTASNVDFDLKNKHNPTIPCPKCPEKGIKYSFKGKLYFYCLSCGFKTLHKLITKRYDK